MTGPGQWGWGQRKPGTGYRLIANHPLAPTEGGWLLNEGGGQRLMDLGGRYFGTVNGNPLWTPKDRGMGLLLDGAGDYLDLGAAGNFTTGDFTISIWTRPTSHSTQVLFYKGQFNATGYYCQFDRSGAGSLMLGTNQSGAQQITETALGLFSNLELFLVTVVRRGTSVRFYKNGAETAYTVQGTHTSPTSSSDSFQVGRYNASGSFDYNGWIGQVTLLQRALTSGEVLRFYNDAYCFVQPPLYQRALGLVTADTAAPATVRTLALLGAGV